MKKPTLQISEHITILYTRERHTSVFYVFFFFFWRHRKTETEYALWKESHRILCFVDHQHKPHVNTKESNSIFQSLSNADHPCSETERRKERVLLDEMKRRNKERKKKKSIHLYLKMYPSIMIYIYVIQYIIN